MLGDGRDGGLPLSALHPPLRSMAEEAERVDLGCAHGCGSSTGPQPGPGPGRAAGMEPGCHPWRKVSTSRHLQVNLAFSYPKMSRG